VSVSARRKLGCWVHERWRTELALRVPGARRLGFRWLDLKNRREHLLLGAEGARICDWADSSFLTVAAVFPEVGGRLLRHCLGEWPIRLADPASWAAPGEPDMSVILPIGGLDRVPQLDIVMRGFMGQDCPGVEIIVVEHDTAARIGRLCPRGVQYVFVPRSTGEAFNKSRALNAGVRVARAATVLLHDGDIVPPTSYVRTLLQKLNGSWDAVRPLRFLFDLDAKASQLFMTSGGTSTPTHVAEIQQHNPGASTALRRDVYNDIGGHDEDFWGWGGEDQEFLDRLETRRLFPGSFIPAIHLWHPSAPNKEGGDRNAGQLAARRRLSPAERIAALVAGPDAPTKDR
jgi:hypothetical protein